MREAGAAERASGSLPATARDRAFDTWAGQRLHQATAGERASVKAAFCDGWDLAMGRTVNHEPEKLDTGSLFPTMGLAHDV